MKNILSRIFISTILPLGLASCGSGDRIEVANPDQAQGNKSDLEETAPVVQVQKAQTTFFTGKIGTTEVELDVIRKPFSNFMNGLIDKGRPTLFLFSDCEHSSIGVKRKQAEITELELLDCALTEWSSVDQPLYDDFFQAIAASKLDDPAVKKFKDEVSQRPRDYYAPDEDLHPDLRTDYFECANSFYYNAALQKTPLHFMDSSADDDPAYDNLRYIAARSFNKSLRLENALSVLSRLYRAKEMDIDTAVKPIRQALENITNIIDGHSYEFKEEERLKLYNIAKKSLDEHFRERDIFPENWLEGEIDFDVELNLDAVKEEAQKIYDVCNEEKEAAEDARDDYRNRQMTERVKALVDQPDFLQDNPVIGFFMGQGHFDGSGDLDEMLREALPNFNVVRIDIVPCRESIIQKLDGSIARCNYQGSDYVVFEECPTAQYIVSLQAKDKPLSQPELSQ